MVFYAVVRDRPKEPKKPQDAINSPQSPSHVLGDVRLLLKNKDFWIISYATFVRYGIFAAFQTLWAGPFLMEGIGLSAVAAGNLIFLLNMGMILSGPLWGVVSDRVFKTRKWLVCWDLGIVALVLVFMAFTGPLTGLILLAALYFSYGLFQPGTLMFVQMKESMPLRMAGTAMTGINFFTMVGAAFFLQSLGGLMQSLYPEASRSLPAFNTAFWFCAAFMASVTILYAFTKDTRGQKN
jgi:sugar phosphate permease